MRNAHEREPTTEAMITLRDQWNEKLGALNLTMVIGDHKSLPLNIKAIYLNVQNYAKLAWLIGNIKWSAQVMMDYKVTKSERTQVWDRLENLYDRGSRKCNHTITARKGTYVIAPKGVGKTAIMPFGSLVEANRGNWTTENTVYCDSMELVNECRRAGLTYGGFVTGCHDIGEVNDKSNWWKLRNLEQARTKYGKICVKRPVMVDEENAAKFVQNDWIGDLEDMAYRQFGVDAPRRPTIPPSIDKERNSWVHCEPEAYKVPQYRSRWAKSHTAVATEREYPDPFTRENAYAPTNENWLRRHKESHPNIRSCQGTEIGHVHKLQTGSVSDATRTLFHKLDSTFRSIEKDTDSKVIAITAMMKMRMSNTPTVNLVPGQKVGLRRTDYGWRVEVPVEFGRTLATMRIMPWFAKRLTKTWVCHNGQADDGGIKGWMHDMIGPTMCQTTESGIDAFMANYHPIIFFAWMKGSELAEHQEMMMELYQEYHDVYVGDEYILNECLKASGKIMTVYDMSYDTREKHGWSAKAYNANSHPENWVMSAAWHTSYWANGSNSIMLSPPWFQPAIQYRRNQLIAFAVQECDHIDDRDMVDGKIQYTTSQQQPQTKSSDRRRPVARIETNAARPETIIDKPYQAEFMRAPGITKPDEAHPNLRLKDRATTKHYIRMRTASLPYTNQALGDNENSIPDAVYEAIQDVLHEGGVVQICNRGAATYPSVDKKIVLCRGKTTSINRRGMTTTITMPIKYSRSLGFIRNIWMTLDCSQNRIIVTNDNWCEMDTPNQKVIFEDDCGSMTTSGVVSIESLGLAWFNKPTIGYSRGEFNHMMQTVGDIYGADELLLTDYLIQTGTKMTSRGLIGKHRFYCSTNGEQTLYAPGKFVWHATRNVEYVTAEWDTVIRGTELEAAMMSLVGHRKSYGEKVYGRE
nr:polyprotein [Alphaendornavirus sp.]